MSPGFKGQAVWYHFFNSDIFMHSLKVIVIRGRCQSLLRLCLLSSWFSTLSLHYLHSTLGLRLFNSFIAYSRTQTKQTISENQMHSKNSGSVPLGPCQGDMRGQMRCYRRKSGLMWVALDISHTRPRAAHTV